MGYYIDLKSISLIDYEKKLINADLLPSRRILKEEISKRFETLKSSGMKTLFDIQQTLKKKDKLKELSKKKPLNEEYLTILLREINSINPKSNKIKDFVSIDPKIIQKLEKEGIKDTVKLFDLVKTKKDRKKLSEELKIKEEDVLELTKLTDLSRIRWIGTAFARILYDSGYDTVEKIACADHEILHQKIAEMNKDKKYFNAQIGKHDILLTVLAAKDVSLEIEY